MEHDNFAWHVLCEGCFYDWRVLRRSGLNPLGAGLRLPRSIQGKHPPDDGHFDTQKVIPGGDIRAGERWYL